MRRRLPFARGFRLSGIRSQSLRPGTLTMGGAMRVPHETHLPSLSSSCNSSHAGQNIFRCVLADGALPHFPQFLHP